MTEYIIRHNTRRDVWSSITLDRSDHTATFGQVYTSDNSAVIVPLETAEMLVAFARTHNEYTVDVVR